MTDGASDTGTYSAFFADATAPATIAQSVPTVPGTTYLVSFSLSSGSGDDDPGNAFVTRFGAASHRLGTVAPSFSLYGFLAVATSTATTLSFSGVSPVDGYFLDDVSVVAQAAPEPATLAVLGLGALAARRRRRG